MSRTQTPIRPTHNTDIPKGYASRLWTKLIPGGIEHRVDDISRRFTGAGWKYLPQELVDEILGLLLNDLDALKACSLTCKRLFGATRPLLHQRVCLVSKPDRMARGYLFGRRRKRDSETFERLICADRSGLLRYTRHLTFKMKDGSFGPRNMQEYLPYLRSITD